MFDEDESKLTQVTVTFRPSARAHSQQTEILLSRTQFHFQQAQREILSLAPSSAHTLQMYASGRLRCRKNEITDCDEDDTF